MEIKQNNGNSNVQKESIINENKLSEDAYANFQMETVTYDMAVDLMEFYQNEFLHRHQLFWKMVIKITTFVAVISFFPFVASAFGIEFSDKTFMWQRTESGFPAVFLFPILGMFFSVFGGILLHGEAVRMNAVNNTKKHINTLLPTVLQYQKLDSNPIENNGNNSQKSKLPKSALHRILHSISSSIVWVSFVGNIILCLISFMMCIQMYGI